MNVTWKIERANLFADPNDPAKKHLVIEVSVSVDGTPTGSVVVEAPPGSTQEAIRAAIDAEVETYKVRDMESHLVSRALVGMEGGS